MKLYKFKITYIYHVISKNLKIYCLNEVIKSLFNNKILHDVIKIYIKKLSFYILHNFKDYFLTIIYVESNKKEKRYQPFIHYFVLTSKF